MEAAGTVAALPPDAAALADDPEYVARALQIGSRVAVVRALSLSPSPPPYAQQSLTPQFPLPLPRRRTPARARRTNTQNILGAHA